ncbi:snurportin-1 [Battus philenor]|uniref:snurportin-1 n=1 Tax=Battus philenor TaxID=42288 RepID=UPI0035D02AF5
MDEVVNKFESVFNKDGTVIDLKQNEHESLFKNWGKGGNQEERRKEILTIQKRNRNDNLDNFRGILDLVNASDNHQIFKSYKDLYRPNIYVAGFNKASSYKKVLMLSEWLIEKPNDFNENWYVVPCPKGIRVLVVSNKGNTNFFSKHGRFLKQCHTALPGGNPSDFNQRRTGFSVLDGFLVESTNTFYVLDLLAWNSQPMTDGETEFRQYWLKSHFQELSDLHNISKTNNITFQLLPMVSCDVESFNHFMMKYPHFESNVPLLDGLLFYHKKAHYVAGETPLVGWLYPYMVNEVLGPHIVINSMYEAERPDDYINQADFIEKFTIKIKQNYRNKQSSRNAMETESISNIKNDVLLSDELEIDHEEEKLDE